MELGKLPAKLDQRTLKLSSYVDRVTLTVPPSANWYQAVASWPMYGNDKVGDCTIAGVAHLIQCWTANAGAIAIPAETDVLSTYNYFSHGDPNAGAVCLDVLNYWRTTGIAGHKIFAFTGISQNTQEELRQSIALFGGSYLGLALPNFVLDGDPLQIPWEISPSAELEDKAPNPSNGHCVVAVGYDAANVYVVTWGQIKSLSWEFFSTYCDEAYAILTQDWIGKNSESPSGFNFSMLQSDLAAIH